MSMKKFALRKEERLSGRKLFSELFSKGRSFSLSPFRITWMLIPDTNPSFPVQAAFVVPKRNFKKATTRNRIRRRMKEAYRLHKSGFIKNQDEKGFQVIFTFFYSAKEESPYAEIENKLIVTLQRLAKEIDGTSISPSRAK